MSWRAVTLLLVLVTALYVAARPWLIDIVGVPNLMLLVIATGVVVSLVASWWQAHNRRYVCPACAHVFSVSMLRNLVSQNWFGRLHCRCPACDEQAWCDIATDDQTSAKS
jgi:hypothetical protein